LIASILLSFCSQSLLPFALLPRFCSLSSPHPFLALPTFSSVTGFAHSHSASSSPRTRFSGVSVSLCAMQVVVG
jgi:hypothetical protein